MCRHTMKSMQNACRFISYTERTRATTQKLQGNEMWLKNKITVENSKELIFRGKERRMILLTNTNFGKVKIITSYFAQKENEKRKYNN